MDGQNQERIYINSIHISPVSLPFITLFAHRQSHQHTWTRGILIFINRSPDTAKIKQKMVYASSKDGLKKKLDGVYTEIQCTDYSEVSHETVLDKVYLFSSYFLMLFNPSRSHAWLVKDNKTNFKVQDFSNANTQ